MNRAVVTGGAGFIGSHVVDALVADGVEVRIIDDLSSGRRENVPPEAALVELDIRDAARVAAELEAFRPDAVFHLAAQIDVRHSVEDPANDARVNVEATAALLEAARRAGVGRVVFSSTGGALYGDAETIPTAEGAPIAPMAPYGQGKFSAEGYCHLYARLHGLSTVCLRYGNVYGPRQDPHGEAGVIAIFCGKAHEGGRPTIFGDGRQTRDYVYAGDVAAANLAAARTDVGGSVNIGTGIETSLLEILDVLRELAPGFDAEPEFAPPRLGELDRSCLDIGLAERVLGWRPTTSLRDGLAAALGALG